MPHAFLFQLRKLFQYGRALRHLPNAVCVETDGGRIFLLSKRLKYLLINLMFRFRLSVCPIPNFVQRKIEFFVLLLNVEFFQ